MDKDNNNLSCTEAEHRQRLKGEALLPKAFRHPILKSEGYIAVLGAGSWGTALAMHLARNKQRVRLWSPDIEQSHEINTTRYNARYLPGVLLPDNLESYHQLDQTLDEARDVLIAVPSHAFRSTLEALQPLIHQEARLILATKGLNKGTHQLLHEVVTEVLGERTVAVLSGPSFAKEVALNLPTAVIIASSSYDFANDLRQRFNSHHFRIYISDDVIGVELGGAVKNIIAIAVGIADGLGFGINARSALITRGLAEIVRLGMVLGGRQKTFMGLSGMGDLILTCTDNQSRNRRFGVALGQGKSVEAAKKEINQVIEGISAVTEIYALAKQHNTSMPICEQVYDILYKNLSAKIAGENLLFRHANGEE